MFQENQTDVYDIVIGTSEFNILTKEFFLITKEAIINNPNISKIYFIITSSYNTINNKKLLINSKDLYYNTNIIVDLLDNNLDIEDDIDNLTTKIILNMYNEYKKYLKLH